MLPGKDYVTRARKVASTPTVTARTLPGSSPPTSTMAVGIDGAAPGVRILPVRVLDANGSGSASNVAKGIIWAADHGARVINLSLGGGRSAGLRRRSSTRAASGWSCRGGREQRQAGNAPMYPAAYPEAIAVAAVNGNLAHSAFSNTGSYLRHLGTR